MSVKQTDWHISAPAHGVFLNHSSYCVARLDDKDPRDLWLQVSHANALKAERDALAARVERLEGALRSLQERVPMSMAREIAAALSPQAEKEPAP